MCVCCFSPIPEPFLTTYNTPSMYFQVEVYSLALENIILIHFEIKNQTNLLSEFDKIFVKRYALVSFEIAYNPFSRNGLCINLHVNINAFQLLSLS